VGTVEFSPVWLRSGAYFSVVPFSFLTVSAGGDAGTSWNFFLSGLDIQSSGVNKRYFPWNKRKTAVSSIRKKFLIILNQSRFQ
jgi:hypothetical protein